MKQVFIILTLLSFHLNAQYETINWFPGSNAILNFTATPAVVSNTFPILAGAATAGGRSSVSDAVGNLKVIAYKNFVYNALGQLVAPQNPTTTGGTGSQNGLVVPIPGNPNLYYIFFVGGTTNFTGNLNYSIFNPTLAGGSGSLTVMNNTVNAYNSSNALCAIRHCNGKDVWVVCGQDSTVPLSTYKIYSYLLTASGINTVPVISSVNVLSDPATSGIGFLRPSPDGRRLAIGSRRNVFPATYSVALSDFDRTTGVLNNSFLVRTINNAQGGLSYFEFSPDGSKLYTVEYPSTIVQLDLCAASPAAVIASANTVVSLPAVSTYSFYRGIQRAINGCIYLSQWTSQGFSNSLAAIQQPNNAGSGCAFSLNVQSLGTGTYTGWLPHYANYLLKPLITINQPDQTCSKVIFNASSSVCASVAGSLSNFYWDFGEPTSPTNTSTLYSPTHSYGTPGNFQVKLILNDGQCVADTLYKQITVLPNSTLNINVTPLSQTVCPGQSTTITASGASGYTWMPGNLSGSLIAVSPQSNTSYTVKGEDNIGCGNSSMALVYVYPVTNLTVNTKPKTICAGQAVTLTASGALSYTWNTGAISHSLSVTPSTTIVYTITAISSQSCYTVFSYTLKVINCNGLPGLQENKSLFTIYPNPATQILNVDLGILQRGIAAIKIFNSLGQIIYSKQNLVSTIEGIDLHSWPKGIYFVEITTSEHYAVRKLLLE